MAETRDIKTYAYGYPRLGRNREFKREIEGYWDGKVSAEQLTESIRALDQERIDTYRRFVDRFPTGEMSLYDPMLDTAVMLGLYPEGRTLDGYFELARGANALEMTKWFNTNYHYLVPEFGGDVKFELNTEELIPHDPERSEVRRPQLEGGIPYVIGPYTFLRLSEEYPQEEFGSILARLVPVYEQLFATLKEQGASLIHVDEPAWATEVPSAHVPMIRDAYMRLGQAADLLVMTYYEAVDFLDEVVDLPVKAIGLDFVHGPDNIENIKRTGFPADKILVAGVVDGHNIWKTNLQQAANLIAQLQEITSGEIWLSNAAPLFHLPVSAAAETEIDPALQERIAFADERLAELRLFKTLLTEGENEETKAWNQYKHPTDHWYDSAVRDQVQSLREQDFEPTLPYAERNLMQRERIGQPLFPTTTIGSFPQTDDVRRTRLAYRSGKISDEEYWSFIQEKIRDLIRLQEEIGLDVLVHGEFERTDMVEYFAERLEGMGTFNKAWVLSYGTRIYRRPVIYGDIRRKGHMTVREVAYAQSLTDKPVKGMLTGPVTILAWSSAREDIPPYEVAFQLALALNDEVRDLEEAGIKVVQIDEPAYRELAPLKRRGWPEYFDWAAKAYRLASRARPETQIHTHMCYSEFNEIMEHIAAMNADVTTIATTRSHGETIEAFEHYRFPRQIGPGVYDVHSPAVPSVDAARSILERVVRLLPRENIWVNPDCGLKTRRWEEVVPSLRNMVEAARTLRET